MIHVTSNGGNDYIDSEGKPLRGKYDASKARLATNKVVLKFKKDQRNFYSCKDCITHLKDFKDVKDHARHHVKMETMKEKYAKASKSQANIRLEAEERNKLNLHYETCNKRFERGDQINKHHSMNHSLGLSIKEGRSLVQINREFCMKGVSSECKENAQVTQDYMCQ